MATESRATTEGIENARPDREARVRPEQPMVPKATFESYYVFSDYPMGTTFTASATNYPRTFTVTWQMLVDDTFSINEMLPAPDGAMPVY